MDEPPAKRLRSATPKIGSCSIISKRISVDGEIFIKKIMYSSSYLVRLDEPAEVNHDDLSVYFISDNSVCNGKINVSEPKSDKIPEYVLNQFFQIIVESGVKLRCLVVGPKQIWISEKLEVISQNRLNYETSHRRAKNKTCLEQITPSASIKDVVRRFGDAYPKLLSFLPEDEEESSSKEVPSSQVEDAKGKKEEIPVADGCKRRQGLYKIFLSDFDPTEKINRAYMWRKQLYLFTKFHDLLVEVGNAEIALTSSQRKRLESRGYIGGIANPNLHAHAYCVGCLCDFCDNASKDNQRAFMMLSFAFPHGENLLYKDLVSFWAYTDIFRFPFIDYKSLIHLTPPISDAEHGYTIFTFSIMMRRNSATNYAKSHKNIFENIVTHVKTHLDFYSKDVPKNYTAESFLAWMEDKPEEIVYGHN